MNTEEEFKRATGKSAGMNFILKNSSICPRRIFGAMGFVLWKTRDVPSAD
jgi:hypothetical protein